MSVRAVLSFDSDTGSVVRFSIPRASKTLTSAQAVAAMQRIIDSGAVITAAGRPLQPKAAKVVATTRKVLV